MPSVSILGHMTVNNVALGFCVFLPDSTTKGKQVVGTIGHPAKMVGAELFPTAIA